MRSGWHRPAGGNAWIMGVLNCTPDSFSDGGNFTDLEAATAHGISMQQAGAAIIDVGGESTRPGAQPVSLNDELKRTIPVVKALSQAGCTISIDTMKAEVMRQAIDAGAAIVNDVSALSHDPASLDVVADSSAEVCLMHKRGNPETMQHNPSYQNVIDEVSRYFEHRIHACTTAGISESRILIDPGIGFGKRLEDNLALIAATAIFKQRFGLPLLLGLSRKSFLGAITGSPVEEREIETGVADAIGIMLGADLVRVHDITRQNRAVCIASALASAHESLASSVDTTRLP